MIKTRRSEENSENHMTLIVAHGLLGKDAEQLVLPCSQDDLVVNVSNVDPCTATVDIQ